MESIKLKKQTRTKKIFFVMFFIVLTIVFSKVSFSEDKSIVALRIAESDLGHLMSLQNTTRTSSNYGRFFISGGSEDDLGKYQQAIEPFCRLYNNPQSNNYHNKSLLKTCLLAGDYTSRLGEWQTSVVGDFHCVSFAKSYKSVMDILADNRTYTVNLNANPFDPNLDFYVENASSTNAEHDYISKNYNNYRAGKYNGSINISHYDGQEDIDEDGFVDKQSTFIVWYNDTVLPYIDSFENNINNWSESESSITDLSYVTSPFCYSGNGCLYFKFNCTGSGYPHLDYYVEGGDINFSNLYTPVFYVYENTTDNFRIEIKAYDKDNGVTNGGAYVIQPNKWSIIGHNGVISNPSNYQKVYRFGIYLFGGDCAAGTISEVYFDTAPINFSVGGVQIILNRTFDDKLKKQTINLSRDVKTENSIIKFRANTPTLTRNISWQFDRKNAWKHMFMTHQMIAEKGNKSNLNRRLWVANQELAAIDCVYQAWNITGIDSLHEGAIDRIQDFFAENSSDPHSSNIVDVFPFRDGVFNEITEVLKDNSGYECLIFSKNHRFTADNRIGFDTGYGDVSFYYLADILNLETNESIRNMMITKLNKTASFLAHTIEYNETGIFLPGYLSSRAPPNRWLWYDFRNNLTLSDMGYPYFFFTFAPYNKFMGKLSNLIYENLGFWNTSSWGGIYEMDHVGRFIDISNTIRNFSETEESPSIYTKFYENEGVFIKKTPFYKAVISFGGNLPSGGSLVFLKGQKVIAFSNSASRNISKPMYGLNLLYRDMVYNSSTNLTLRNEASINNTVEYSNNTLLVNGYLNQYDAFKNITKYYYKIKYTFYNGSMVINITNTNLSNFSVSFLSIGNYSGFMNFTRNNLIRIHNSTFVFFNNGKLNSKVEYLNFLPAYIDEIQFGKPESFVYYIIFNNTYESSKYQVLDLFNQKTNVPIYLDEDKSNYTEYHINCGNEMPQGTYTITSVLEVPLCRSISSIKLKTEDNQTYNFNKTDWTCISSKKVAFTHPIYCPSSNSNIIYINYTKALNISLVVWYTFNNGSAYDFSNNENNGILYNGVVINRTEGLTSLGASFDGQDDYIEVPYNSLTNLTSSFSVAFWIKPDDYAHTNGRIVMGNYVLHGGTYNNNSGWLIGRDCPGTALNFTVYNGYGNKGEVSIPSFYTKYQNKWKRITCVFEHGDFIKIYIDGKLYDSQTSNVPTSVYFNSSFKNINIGRSVEDRSYFNGSLDDIKIWNRSLSDEEVRSEYIFSYKNRQFSRYTKQYGNYRIKGAELLTPVIGYPLNRSVITSSPNITFYCENYNGNSSCYELGSDVDPHTFDETNYTIRLHYVDNDTYYYKKTKNNYQPFDTSIGTYVVDVKARVNESWSNWSEGSWFYYSPSSSSTIRIFMDSYDKNVSYEFGTTPNVTVDTINHYAFGLPDYKDVCVDLDAPNYGTNFTCEKTPFWFYIPLRNFTIQTFSDGSSNKLLVVNNSCPVQATIDLMSGLSYESASFKINQSTPLYAKYIKVDYDSNGTYDIYLPGTPVDTYFKITSFNDSTTTKKITCNNSTNCSRVFYINLPNINLNFSSIKFSLMSNGKNYNTLENKSLTKYYFYINRTGTITHATIGLVLNSTKLDLWVGNSSKIFSFNETESKPKNVSLFVYNENHEENMIDQDFQTYTKIDETYKYLYINTSLYNFSYLKDYGINIDQIKFWKSTKQNSDSESRIYIYVYDYSTGTWKKYGYFPSCPGSTRYKPTNCTTTLDTSSITPADATHPIIKLKFRSYGDSRFSADYHEIYNVSLSYSTNANINLSFDSELQSFINEQSLPSKFWLEINNTGSGDSYLKNLDVRKSAYYNIDTYPGNFGSKGTSISKSLDETNPWYVFSISPDFINEEYSRYGSSINRTFPINLTFKYLEAPVNFSIAALKYTNEIPLNTSIITSYAENHTNLNMSFLALNNGTINIYDVEFGISPERTFRLFAHEESNISTNDTKYFKTHESEFSISLPLNIEYWEIFPFYPTQKHLEPFGQDETTPIWTLSTLSNEPFDIYEYINNSIHSCVKINTTTESFYYNILPLPLIFLSFDDGTVQNEIKNDITLYNSSTVHISTDGGVDNKSFKKGGGYISVINDKKVSQGAKSFALYFKLNTDSDLQFLLSRGTILYGEDELTNYSLRLVREDFPTYDLIRFCRSNITWDSANPNVTINGSCISTRFTYDPFYDNSWHTVLISMNLTENKTEFVKFVLDNSTSVSGRTHGQQSDSRTIPPLEYIGASKTGNDEYNAFLDNFYEYNIVFNETHKRLFNNYIIYNSSYNSLLLNEEPAIVCKDITFKPCKLWNYVDLDCSYGTPIQTPVFKFVSLCKGCVKTYDWYR